MDINHLLMVADFSEDSLIRQSLKRKLLDDSVKGRGASFIKTNTLQRNRARLTVVIGAIILVTLLALPQSGSLAQSVIRILQTWRLGEATTAVRVDGDFAAVPGEDGQIIIQPAPQELPEDIPNEGGSALATNISFEAAQELVDFQILQPGFIPEGYESQGVNVANVESVQMDYMRLNEMGLIGLTQTVAGGINGNTQVSFSSDIEPVEVQVNGTRGLWMAATGDFGLLVWESDGVNYQLQLIGVQIAESLH